VQLFHYHLVTSKVRQTEARYLGKLGFELVARHGRIGEEPTSFEAGVSWDQLDGRGFKLRLSELERGAVNVVIQPGQWDLPRVDHIGLALSDDEFADAIVRASERDLRIQEHGGRRTFVATGVGYRLELHPPRDWLDELLAGTELLRLSELQLQADDPIAKATVLADLLDVDADRGDVGIGDTVVRFVPGGPEGRPELYAELFV
jgi:catechol 2,3-dioxygenase-like lactoylglutathione lyase family enzyme